MPEEVLEALAGLMKLNLREISKARRVLIATERQQQVIFELVAASVNTTVDKVQFDAATGTWSFEPPQPASPAQ